MEGKYYNGSYKILYEGVEWIYLAQNRDQGSCEHGNEPQGPIKDVEFLDLVSDYQLLREDSAPWS
jgi:hypothetical protein